jgi:hypothetical protein
MEEEYSVDIYADLVDENVNTGAQEVTSYTTKVLYMHVHII